MTSNNVIAFPIKKKIASSIQAVPKTPEEIAVNVNQMKFNHINETLGVLVPMIFSNIEIAGFDFLPEEGEPDPNIKDGALFVETLRSMLCKFYGIEHPLQRVAEDIFIKVGEDTFELADELMITFEKGNG